MKNEQWKRRYYDGRYKTLDTSMVQDIGRVEQFASEEYGIKYEDLRVYDKPRVQKVLGRMGLEHLGIVDLERSSIEPINLQRELGSVAIYNARNLLARMRLNEQIDAGDFMTVISEDELAAAGAVEYLGDRGVIEVCADGDVKNRLYSRREVVDKLSCNDEGLAHFNGHKQRKAVEIDAIRERSKELLAEMGEGWVDLLDYMHPQMRKAVDGALTDYSDSDMISDLYRRGEGGNFEINGARTHIRRRPDTLEPESLSDTDIFTQPSLR